LDNETGGSKVGKINCAEAGGLAEDYIGFTGICFGMKCTNDQVIKAVPVDISGFGNAESGKASGFPADDKAGGRGKIRQIDWAEASRLAENHIGLTGIRPTRSPKAAPTIRSSKPSPLTSPAPDTLEPACSLKPAAPEISKPALGARLVRSTDANPLDLPKIT
jgi:hypothetical protein